MFTNSTEVYLSVNTFVFNICCNFCFVVRSHLLITCYNCSFTDVYNAHDTDVFIYVYHLSPRYIYLTLHTLPRLSAGLSGGVLYIVSTMFTLQYWHETAAEWRGAGFSSTSLDCARRRMRGALEECGGCVRFRIEHLPSLSPVPAVLSA